MRALISFAILVSIVLSGCRNETLDAEVAGGSWPSEFGGFLITTRDSNWRFAWNNRDIEDPIFTKVETVAIGSEVSILIFFVNPTVDEDGIAKVFCDIRITRPDLTVFIDEMGLGCYEGPVHGKATDIRLSDSVINFRGDSGDQIGAWIIEVKLIDQVSGARIELATSIELIIEGSSK